MNNDSIKATRALLFRLIAAGFVLHLLGDTVLAYFRGGEQAPTPALLAVSCVVLGGGAVAILVIAFKTWKLEKNKAQSQEDELPEETDDSHRQD